MSRVFVKAASFAADIALTFDWYAKEAGETIAWRYFTAVDRTLAKLAQHSGLGKKRRFRHPELQGLHSFRVEPPFEVHLIFYRYTDKELSAERLMSGRRDLGRRLREPPGSAID
jgi:plasmid stabilization system protein ParE